MNSTAKRYASLVLATGCIAVALLLGWRHRPLRAPQEIVVTGLPPGVKRQRLASRIATTTEQPTPLSTKASRAHGVVRDSARETSISGATVRVSRLDEVMAEAKTDASGEFDLPCDENQKLEVKAVGFLSRTVPLRCEDGLRVLLTPGVTIEGHVFAPDGRPAAGAVVRCIEGIQQRADVETAAGDDGAFSLGCGAGDLHLRAEHPSGAPASIELGAQSPGARLLDLTLILRAGRVLEGKVVSEKGAPANARVFVQEGAQWERPILVATDPAGSFRTRISAKAHLVVAIDEHGRTTTVARIPAGSEALSPLVLVLPEWGTLHGRIVGDTAEATVIAWRDPASARAPGEPARVRDSLGQLLTGGTYFRSARVEGAAFTFEGLEPGVYTLTATSKLASGKATVEMPATAEAAIVMRPTADLDLDIHWDDGRAAEGTLRLSSGDWARFIPLVRSAVHAKALAVGPCKIELIPRGGAIPEPIEIALVAGANAFTWTVPSGSLEVQGVVVDSASGAAIEGAQVSTPLDEWFGWTKSSSFALSDEHGAFSVRVTSLDKPVFLFREGYLSQVVPARDASIVRLGRGVESNQVRAPDFFERLRRAKEAAAQDASE